MNYLSKLASANPVSGWTSDSTQPTNLMIQELDSYFVCNRFKIQTFLCLLVIVANTKMLTITWPVFFIKINWAKQGRTILRKTSILGFCFLVVFIFSDMPTSNMRKCWKDLNYIFLIASSYVRKRQGALGSVQFYDNGN